MKNERMTKTSAPQLSWLKMPIYAHFFSAGNFNLHSSQIGLVFGVSSGFISRSVQTVHARLQVSVCMCSGYNLLHPG